MVEVQTFCRTKHRDILTSQHFCLIIVVSYPALSPVEGTHLIKSFEEIEVGTMSRSITHISIYPESISWHVKRQSCVFQLELLDIHLPLVGLWRSIGRYGITQFYRQTGIRQQGVIYMDKFLAQVDAMGTQCHLPDITLDTHLVYPVGGVDLHTSEVQLVHHYLPLE